MIPFYDIKRVIAPYQEDLKQAASSVIESGKYILGPQLKMFEASFATYCNVKHCIGVGSGYDALDIVLKAWLAQGKIKAGDEVLLPANTFVATALAVVQNQLKPVFIAPNPTTYLVEVADILKGITNLSKVIIPVHLYGQMVDMEAVNKLAVSHDLLVLEDAAQAHGASFQGNSPGTLGHAAAFSFYPAKNLGALGDAGAVVTQDKELANMIRKISNYGSDQKYIHDVLGVNARLDEIQAAFLNVRLPHLPDELKLRDEIAQKYLNGINNRKVALPKVASSSVHAWHLFVLQVKERDLFSEYLVQCGIETMIHYPKDLRENGLFSRDVLQKRSVHQNIISIPLYPGMLEQEVTSVIEAVNNF